MLISNRKFFPNPVPRSTRLILREKGDGPSKAKNRHTNQAPIKQVHSIGLPPLRRNGPRPKKEQQGKVENIKTVGKSSEPMGDARIARGARSELELKNAEQKQRERNSNRQVTAQHGSNRRSRGGETAKENQRREQQVEKQRGQPPRRQRVRRRASLS